MAKTENSKGPFEKVMHEPSTESGQTSPVASDELTVVPDTSPAPAKMAPSSPSSKREKEVSVSVSTRTCVSISSPKVAESSKASLAKALSATSSDDESEEIDEDRYVHTPALMRFALSNWFPCSNAVVVSNELAFLLFKLSSGVHIDLAETILEQIMSFRKGRNPSFNLSLMLDNNAEEEPSSDIMSEITERLSQAKSSKRTTRMDSPDDTEAAPVDAASISVATEIAESGLHEWKIASCRF